MAVVGTLLSLLVFLSLFGTFLIFYLPIWMAEDESSFTSGIQQSLATLQNNVQTQAVRGGPAVLAAPFTLSSQSVPLLAVPTQATITFLPNTAGVFVNISAPGFFNNSNPGTTSPLTMSVNLGTFQVQVPNRYIQGQTLQMENGGMVQSQTDTSQVLAFPPLFSVAKIGSAVNVSLMVLNLVGNATRITSPGTVDVYSHLLGAIQSFKSAGAVASLTLTVRTHFPCAWSTFFQQVRTTQNLSAQMTVAGFDSGATCALTNGNPQALTVTLTTLSSVTVLVGTFQVVSGIGLA